MSKNAVLPAWELNFRGFLFFCVFCVFWDHLENSSFTCMGAQFSKNRSTFLRFFAILGDAKKTCFHLPLFFMFFHHFWCFFGGLWASFGVLLEPLSSLWLSGVILLGAFGSPGLSVDPLCYFSWCRWLVWAVCGLGDRSGTVFFFIFNSFWCHFLSNSGVEF